MDILSVKPVNYKLDILHPTTGAKIGLCVELRDAQSDNVKAEERRVIDKISKQRMRGKNVKSEEVEEDRKEYLVAAIVGWDWAPDGSFGGEKLPFNRLNGLKVVSVFWIANQIDEALAEPANFFRN